MQKTFLRSTALLVLFVELLLSLSEERTFDSHQHRLADIAERAAFTCANAAVAAITHDHLSAQIVG